MGDLEMLLPVEIAGGEDVASLVQVLLDSGKTLGIDISPDMALRLIQNRQTALRTTGRLEFGPGILPELVKAFADSPFIECLERDLCALNEAFYQLKNETREALSDEELLDWMEKSFNGWCKGSLDLLMGRGLEHIYTLRRRQFFTILM